MRGRAMPTEPEFKPELIALGQTIRRERQAQGLSIEALAFKAGVSAGHLGRIERGHGNPRLETLLALLDALGITFAQLVGAAEKEGT
jgi:XRE family aerobic/anaerobic benzoate catabolism transcriptional regulator